ncbi:DUF892 family protein [Mucilaginibacter sp. JRF]|uniref:DUF892 family protein n=1 Tax=Mucilaginibacter sp. JRF TaxID=2780088 RepID=UPI0018811339|nr:DUF892 family protein [Mucilaginibacter sp. JRF]MBE9584255.1 DUF892 family protein [Mucilaginibacter sp. JRF]
MSESPIPSAKSFQGFLEPEELKVFFTSHLSRVYCVKLHLLDKLPVLADNVYLQDLRLGIGETFDDVQMQIHRMDEIFSLLDTEFSMNHCEGMNSMFEDAFADVHLTAEKSTLCDLAILYYMSNIESMEMASFQLLRMTAIKLNNDHVSQLLTENFDEAKADRSLMLMITAKCLANS